MSSTRDDARYRELARLGSGGMATVMLAEDTRLGRRVALKRLHTATDVQSITRLKREALVGASLSHPNLVSIYDVHTEEDGSVVIVMEYVEGETLRDRIKTRGRLPPGEAIPVLEGVAAALDAIHERGIVHRDVKPANVLLGRDGAVKLADLGVAAVADRTRITSADAVVGSFSYMAPEQLESGPSKPAMDVYALGAVAFEMLSGEKARLESNPVALAHAISTQPPPDLSDRWPQAPAAAAAVLQRAMASDPSKRPPSAGALVGELRGAVGLGTAKTRVVGQGRDRPAGAAALGAAGAAGAAAGGGAAAAAGAAGAGAARAPRPQRAPRSPAGGPRRPTADPGRRPPSRPVRPTPFSGPAPARSSARRPWLPAALLVLAVLIIAGVALALSSSGGGSPATSGHSSSTGSASTATHHSSTSASSSSSSAPASSSSTPSSTSTGSGSSTGTGTAPSSGSGGAGAATGGAGAGGLAAAATTPSSAVQAFYENAARHNYATAWSFADQRMRSQLGGYSSFQNQMSSVRSITFHRLRSTGTSSSSATVSLATTSVQTSRTQNCSGTARTLRSGGRWLLDGISISCS